MENFKNGDLVIYDNGYKIEFGKIKQICPDLNSAWVWYHEGDTAAKTSFEYLKYIENEYAIKNIIEKQID